MSIQKLVITAVSPIDFISRILEAGKNGAVLKDRTFPRLKGLPYAVELEVEVEGSSEILSSPGVNAIPVPMSEKVYSKEELEILDWDIFKKACKAYGITGRDRNLLTTKYLQATNQIE